MAELRDSFLRALLTHIEAGHGLALAWSHPWQCCAGARENRGPAGCTCWQPVYDVDQVSPALETVCALLLGEAEPDVRDGMCDDCAYRPGSPEKTGNAGYKGSPDQLDRQAREGRTFFCHDGFRQPVAWRHPVGLRIPAQLCGDYQPLIVDGVPYRADGRPGLVCAGYAARRRALLARDEREAAAGGGGG